MKREPQRHRSIRECRCPICGKQYIECPHATHEMYTRLEGKYRQLHQEYMWLFEKVRKKEIAEFWKKRQYTNWQDVDPLAALDDDAYFEKVFKPMVERWKKK